jgi:hypothetical protein
MRARVPCSLTSPASRSTLPRSIITSLRPLVPLRMRIGERRALLKGDGRSAQHQCQLRGAHAYFPYHLLGGSSGRFDSVRVHRANNHGTSILAGRSGLPLLRPLVALALAGGDFPVNLGLLAVRAGMVATDVSFKAVDLCPGAIERVSHPPERLVATPQVRAGQMIALLVEPLLPLVGKPLALVGEPLALVGEPLALVGNAHARIGKGFALVAGTVSFVCATLLFV